MSAIECFVDDTMIEVNGKIVRGIVVTCSFCDKAIECAGVDSQQLRCKALSALQKEGCREPFASHVIPPDTIE